MPTPPDTAKTTLIRTPDQLLAMLDLLDRVKVRARWTADVWHGGTIPTDVFCTLLVDVDDRVRSGLHRGAVRRMQASGGRDRRAANRYVRQLRLVTVESVRQLAEDIGPVCPGCGEPGPACPGCSCVRGDA